MDRSSVLGVTVGAVAILGGNALEGGHASALVQPTAAMIVIGGTLSACLISYPMDVAVRAMRALRTVFASPASAGHAEIVEELATYAHIARRDGIVALERVAQGASHPFLAKAIAMAVDGVDSKAMRDSLERMLDALDERGEEPARFWESAGGFAPTIGIIGAVMGLIHVMQNLRDVSAVGQGIAVAFVATIYGVALANLLFLPAAGKIRHRHRAEMSRLTLMMDGAIAIQEGRSPQTIRDRLFLSLDEPVAKVEVPKIGRVKRVREAVG